MEYGTSSSFKTEAETHTYNCIITHKVEETYTTVAVDVPEDAFTEKDGEVAAEPAAEAAEAPAETTEA